MECLFLLFLRFLRFDWLEIHDGDSMDAPLIDGTKYCGTDIPSNTTIDSTGHSLFIRFKTDSTIRRSGFEINVDCGTHIQNTK